MKNLKAIVILTVFFITISASGLLAQGRQAKTSGAKAAYDYPTEVGAKKKKKKKHQKQPKRKSKAPFKKNRSPWL